MPTLRAIASITSGLYRDMVSGRVYQQEEFLASMPQSVLARSVRIEKLAPGAYALHAENGEPQVFELWSRRRSSRALAEME